MTALAEDQVRSYLLGELTEEERERIDERIVTDSTFLEEVEATEGDLISEYLADTLPGSDRLSFEGFFLAAQEHRERLEHARALRTCLLSAAERPRRVPLPGWWNAIAESAAPSRAPKWVMAAAALAIVLAGSLLLSPWRRSAGGAAVLTLAPGVSMGGAEAHEVWLGDGTESLQVTLRLEGEPFPGYRAELTPQSSPDDLWWSAQLEPSGGAVVANVPARLLTPGAYLIALNGIRVDGRSVPAGRYVFRVHR